ncbi:hypothetical protein Y032_0924g3056, partial [Ancylostoma ceylanicum]
RPHGERLTSKVSSVGAAFKCDCKVHAHFMAIEDPPLVDRISDASKKATNALSKWWTDVVTDSRPPANPEKMVSVKQLPIYSENDQHQQYKFVVEEPLPLQREFATVRQAFNTEYERFSGRFKAVDRTVTKSKDVLVKTKTYLEDEWTVLPKAAAITVGGMAGFVLGLKRSAGILLSELFFHTRDFNRDRYFRALTHRTADGAWLSDVDVGCCVARAA